VESKEYVDLLRGEKAIICLAHFAGEECDGRGDALIIDEGRQIAVMLQDCGDPNVTLIKAGAIVKFIRHSEAESKIVGSPAYSRPVVLAGRRIT
jgi:hypothetical protein